MRHGTYCTLMLVATRKMTVGAANVRIDCMAMSGLAGAESQVVWLRRLHLRKCQCREKTPPCRNCPKCKGNEDIMSHNDPTLQYQLCQLRFKCEICSCRFVSTSHDIPVWHLLPGLYNVGLMSMPSGFHANLWICLLEIVWCSGLVVQDRLVLGPSVAWHPQMLREKVHPVLDVCLTQERWACTESPHSWHSRGSWGHSSTMT